MTALWGAHAAKSAALAMLKGCVQLRRQYRPDPATATVRTDVRLQVVARESPYVPKATYEAYRPRGALLPCTSRLIQKSNEPEHFSLDCTCLTSSKPRPLLAPVTTYTVPFAMSVRSSDDAGPLYNLPGVSIFVEQDT